MYSVIVYSELITFPCINLILSYLCTISQIIIIRILLWRLILYHAYCNLLTSSKSNLVDLWNTKYIIIIIIIINQLPPKCDYEMTAGSSLDVRLLWSLTVCDGAGGGSGDGYLTTMFDLQGICYMDVDGTLMVNYERKHII